MAVQTKDTLKAYFETGDFPTQAQFADLIDSLLHVTGSIPISQVTGLQAVLDGLVQAGPLTDTFDADTTVTLPTAQLVREIVLEGTAAATVTIRLKGDSGTDQEVTMVSGKRAVVIIEEWFDAADEIDFIDPTAEFGYRIYRTF